MSTKDLDREQMSSASEKRASVYAGWIYHVGSNSMGYQFCNPRYLVIKGKYVEMYKRDPNDFPSKKPIRRGVAGKFTMVKEIGRQIFHGRVLYVLKIYSRVDHGKHGEIACTSAEEVEKWMSAFRHAKEEAEYVSNKLSFINNETEFNVNGPRYHSKSYLSKLIYIGRGPESLLRRPSMVAQDPLPAVSYTKQAGDAVEQTDWRCFRTVNGLRIFEDIKSENGAIMKSVGVVEATPEMIFEMIMTLDISLRHQWDTLTGQLELVEHIDGHTDIVYGTFDPKYFKRWSSLFSYKRYYVFSRYWRRHQDGSYYITQMEVSHKGAPRKPGYRKITLNPGVWEITPLPSKPGTGTPRSLVTQIMEIKSTGWGRWKKSHYSKFHATVPYAMLCRTAGLREYFSAEALHGVEERLVTKSIVNHDESTCETTRLSQVETNEEFYDAITAGDPADEDDDDSEEEEKKPLNKTGSHKLRRVTWGVMLLSKRPPAPGDNGELMLGCSAMEINMKLFKSTLRHQSSEKDQNCWCDPGGQGFMVRGKTYMKDYLKVPGGDPLLKLLTVDWLKSDDKIGAIAKHPASIVQTPAGKALPFIFVVNLQVPAKPNYSLVFYYAADRPIRPGSLLDKFANGDDAFRNARFKLIPSIVEGYWVVKRAVGTKACLLGRAVTCHYIREDNYFEIDVDIGSSSVARGVIGLVLGYVTNIVVDLAVLIEAKEESELPEYLLGTTRINRIVPEDAKAYETPLNLCSRQSLPM
ncbi:protein ENHANCED DISEASE RESISTANCE 2 isoform X2 [Selaginella moellendorffii]|uniref:protein ENHANCED DISEASE RESISTANCE 2 isoform X2 n=1 Tax=Selaginella moellendorffii TaxID=88036 RepID=UPI000D1C3914|nr:protein ENHANCED DISEASE RESISTANCE 2 isoform X2 [Selaginella moellendorffii]|eukprot:XP_024530767.1 protein ENHANCED DISEASE RESISTANCE 2 isoform X2 [Selaginella moellendorffii]